MKNKKTHKNKKAELSVPMTYILYLVVGIVCLLVARQVAAPILDGIANALARPSAYDIAIIDDNDANPYELEFYSSSIKNYAKVSPLSSQNNPPVDIATGDLDLNKRGEETAVIMGAENNNKVYLFDSAGEKYDEFSVKSHARYIAIGDVIPSPSFPGNEIVVMTEKTKDQAPFLLIFAHENGIWTQKCSDHYGGAEFRGMAVGKFDPAAPNEELIVTYIENGGSSGVRALGFKNATDCEVTRVITPLHSLDISSNYDTTDSGYNLMAAGELDSTNAGEEIVMIERHWSQTRSDTFFEGRSPWENNDNLVFFNYNGKYNKVDSKNKGLADIAVGLLYGGAENVIVAIDWNWDGDCDIDSCWWSYNSKKDALEIYKKDGTVQKGDITELNNEGDLQKLAIFRYRK